MTHDTLTIGLLNNMPGGVLKQTETQFRDLLSATCPGRNVRIELFCLPERLHEGAAQAHVAKCYRPFGELFEIPLDGLIVTGMEPYAASLLDETFWHSLATVVDFARERRLPTVWSCLAAHAAVLYLDGIERRRRATKLSGLYEVLPAYAAHPLAVGLPPINLTPHSRLYGLDEPDLNACGYQVLTRAAISTTPGGDVDAFAMRSLPFLFLQGHPEYDSRSLLREYVRDARRYLDGQSSLYPRIPIAYFNDATAASLTALQGRVAKDASGEAHLQDLSEIIRNASVRDHRATTAHSPFSNWIASVGAASDTPARTILNLPSMAGTCAQ